MGVREGSRESGETGVILFSGRSKIKFGRPPEHLGKFGVYACKLHPSYRTAFTHHIHTIHTYVFSNAR